MRFEHEPDHAEHAVHRRSNFMAHRGEKARLGLVRFLRLGEIALGMGDRIACFAELAGDRESKSEDADGGAEENADDDGGCGKCRRKHDGRNERGRQDQRGRRHGEGEASRHGGFGQAGKAAL